LSGLIPARLKHRKWRSPNEVLSDYFIRIRLWKWSSVSLIYEYFPVLVQFYQARCSGLKCVYDQPLFPLSCCVSQSSFMWFTFFSRWRFYLLPLITLVLLRISPLERTYFWLKTVTFVILINDKFPPELSLLAAQNKTQPTSSETWAWRHQYSVSRLIVYSLTEYIYTLKCIETWKNEFYSHKKLID